MAKIIDKRKKININEDKIAPGKDISEKPGKKIRRIALHLLIIGMVILILLILTESVNFFFSIVIFMSVSLLSLVLLFVGLILDMFSSKTEKCDYRDVYHYFNGKDLAGEQGEDFACSVFAYLPDTYTIYRNTVLYYEGKKSEIDTIIVGPGGIFVAEVKNFKGELYGDYSDNEWIKVKQSYNETFQKDVYNPVKQVSTHVFRLARNLRFRGINNYVQSIVYFVNPECILNITGTTDTYVFTRARGDEQRMLDLIIHGNYPLTDGQKNAVNRYLMSL